MVNRKLRNAGDSPHDVTVLLTAPTGTAAYNISGSTMHSSFLLSACGSSRFDSLSAEKLSMLKNKYAKIQVLVNDEISMVDENLLQRIHLHHIHNNRHTNSSTVCWSKCSYCEGVVASWRASRFRTFGAPNPEMDFRDGGLICSKLQDMIVKIIRADQVHF